MRRVKDGSHHFFEKALLFSAHCADPVHAHPDCRELGRA
jgi:hypothetical protein